MCVSRICLDSMGFGDPTIGQHSWTIGEEPTREIISVQNHYNLIMREKEREMQVLMR